MTAVVAEPTTARRRAHASLPDEVDVAVIGAGLGGLVAAAALAQRGLRVSIFESHYVAGGCATQFGRGPKSRRYNFDVGLHYVGDCEEGGAIPSILRDVGVAVDFTPMDQDGFDTLVFPGLRFRIPADVDLYRERLVSLFPRERRGIDRYVSLVRAVMQASRALDAGKRPGPIEMAKLALAGLRIAPHRNATIADVLDSVTHEPALRAILLGQSGDYGLPPSRVSAMLHLGLAGHYFRGAYYPKGGGQVIADRLCARIEALGGSIHLRHPVERVLVRDGRAIGVRLAPRAGDPAHEVRAKVVLSNADLKRTFLELIGPEHLPSSWVARAAGFEMAAALFITCLGIEGDLRALGMRATNYWQFDDLDVERFYQDLGRHDGGPIRAKGCYVTSATLKDPDDPEHHAPRGIGNVEVMTVVPSSLSRWQVDDADVATWGYKRNDAYHAIKSDLEAQMIERLDAMFPGAAARVVFRESATPVSHRRYTGATDGTGYGLAATPSQFFEHRPGYRGPLAGLYLAGASTRAGHGIVGAMASGRNAARRVLHDLDRASLRR